MRAERSTAAVVVAIALASACGGHGTTAPPEKRDAGVAKADTPLEIKARPLGLGDVGAYGWRKRAGQAAFREARKAEDKGDWAGVSASCKKALAADPAHLEAAYLLAVALASLGKHDELVTPLQVAESGDFGKWGPASLEQPGLRAFLGTPLGEAWRRRVDADRAAYAAAISRSVVISSNYELYAYDPTGPRYYRLTRTYGAVLGALAIPGQHAIAYVTKSRIDKQSRYGVGIVDLAKGHASRPQTIPVAGPITVAALAKGGVWIGGPGGASWELADDKLKANPAKVARPPGPYLEVSGRNVRLHRKPIEITADFDERSLASQIRLDTSKRVVSVPSPGQIDGSTVVWSPDRSRLALVAPLDERCSKPGAAVFVVEAATGSLKEIARGPAFAVEWLSDRKLVIADDATVAIHDLDTQAATPIPGASSLITPQHRPRCTDDQDPPDDAPPEE